MSRKDSNVTFTGPAAGRLRAVSVLLLVLLAGCAATPEPAPAPQPKPLPLVDRTHETEYRLESVAEKLTSADRFDAQGQREAAAAILATAREVLPADHSREKWYMDVLLAAVWGRGGDGRDSEKAETLLKSVLQSASSDARLSGDARLAQVAVCLGAEDLSGARAAGNAAEEEFTRAQAWARLADARRELAAGYMDYDLVADAVAVSRRGAELAEKLQDQARVLRAWLDVGSYTPADQAVAIDEAFTHAYYAAYRVGRASWRNAVIATAVDRFFRAGHNELAARWGDRLRDDDGLWPNPKAAGLQAGAHAMLSAQYALALHAARPNDSRVAESLKTAEKALSATGGDDPELTELAAKVGAALLQIRSGK